MCRLRRDAWAHMSVWLDGAHGHQQALPHAVIVKSSHRTHCLHSRRDTCSAFHRAVPHYVGGSAYDDYRTPGDCRVRCCQSVAVCWTNSLRVLGWRPSWCCRGMSPALLRGVAQ